MEAALDLLSAGPALPLVDCEHVVDAVADLVGQVLARSSATEGRDTPLTALADEAIETIARLAPS